MNKLLILLFVFLYQNLNAQPVEQLDELVVVDKKMKNFKISKGKGIRNTLFNADFDNYYYVLDSLPYGYLDKLTFWYSTNFPVLDFNDAEKAKVIYENWCSSCFFDVNIYDYENGQLTKLTDESIVVSLEKTKKVLVKKTFDFSNYNLVGTQFVLSITPSKKLQNCQNCATYGITLFVDENESVFLKNKNKFIKGKGLKYDLGVRSKKY